MPVRPLRTTWLGMWGAHLVALLAAGTLAAVAVPPANAAPQGFGVVSLTPDGHDSNVASGAGDYFPMWPDADGSKVAFLSYSTNLGGPPTDARPQVYVRDRVAGTTSAGSVDTDGRFIGNVIRMRLSANGRYLAFYAFGESSSGVYVRDLTTATTVSVASPSQYFSLDNEGHVRFDTSAVTPNGRYTVGYESSIAQQIVVTDTQTGAVRRADVSVDGTPADHQSFGVGASISADGRYATFASNASNLVEGTTSPCAPNRCENIFRKDLVTGEVINVSGAMVGSSAGGRVGQTTSVSGDGNLVAFCALGLSGPDEPASLQQFPLVRVANISEGTIRAVSYDDTAGLIDSHSFDCGSRLTDDGSTVLVAGTATGHPSSQVWAEPAQRDVIPDPTLPPDSTAPTINVVTPVEGAKYRPPLSLWGITLVPAAAASYSCADEAGGSGIASCTGSVANGAPLVTSPAGAKTFTVTAEDNAGNTTVKSVHYTAGLVGCILPGFCF